MSKLIDKIKKINENTLNYIVIYEDLYGRKYFDRTNTTLKKILEHSTVLRDTGYEKIEIHESKRIN